MMRGIRSIRRKLLLIVLLTTLTALAVCVGALVAHDLRAYHRYVLADMATQAELLGRMTAPALAFDDRRLATENLNLLRIRSEVRGAAIYNARGGLFASYSQSGAASPIPKLPEPDGVRVDGHDLILFKRIIQGGEILGTVYLLADYELVSRVFDNLGLALVMIGVAMAVAWLMMGRLEKVITGPILAIAGIAREVMAGRDYSRRAVKTSHDEVGELVDSFNGMLAEIENRTRALEASNREIAREAGERTVAQQEVQRLNAELEQRVHERTLQLESANADLMLATEEAERANQAKSTFLSNMSHELRTPLNAILGFGQILASADFPATAEQKTDYATQILKAGNHLLTLIDEILDLAKIESGKVHLSPEPIILSDLLAECREMIEPLCARRGIRAIFPKAGGLRVIADRTRLKQILLNLLSNAVKYNREAGAVVVDCSRSGAERIRISVQDTGMGLSEDDLAGLFQPFNRLGQEGGEEQGTGIGLVVTKRLVELMEGNIGVQSTVGIGSIFWIELACAPTTAEDVRDELPDALLPAPGAAGKATVLYVEDNPANLRLIEDIIRYKTDLRLLTAPDGNLGLQLALAHLPQVILLDMHLPGLSGQDIQRILKEDPRTTHIPVIALTANAMPREVAKGLAAGFFRYLTKPIDLKEFTAALEGALEIAGPRLDGHGPAG